MSEQGDDKLARESYDRNPPPWRTYSGKSMTWLCTPSSRTHLGAVSTFTTFQTELGTAIATKELCEWPGEGSSNDVFDTYELVMFTRHPLSLKDAKDEATPFGRAHRSINAILNCVAPYSAQATLNPYETCEFPRDMKSVGGKCLIFDAYGLTGAHAEFGLFAIIIVRRWNTRASMAAAT